MGQCHDFAVGETSAMALLTDVTLGAPLDGANLNTNLHLIEGGLADLGPYVISGLVPSAGAGLSVSVTSGVASLGGRLTIGSSFLITALANGTLNHLYLLNTGTGTSNTTGVQPANSVKLGTATTAGGVVTLVGTNWASGRQLRINLWDAVHGGGAGHPRAVDLASWHATNNEGNEVKGVLPAGATPGITAPLTLTLDDASGSTTTYPLRIRHTNSGGVGANGIGAGVQYEVENTGGTVSTAGVERLLTENDIAANLTTRWEWEVYNNNIARVVMRAGPDHVRIESAVPGTADRAALCLGTGGYLGGAGNFIGSANGTLLGGNMDAGYAGDYLNFQSDGVIYAKITGTGVAELATWDAVNNAVATVLTIRHMTNGAPAAAAGMGARLSFEAETSTNDVPNIAAQIDAVLTTVTAGAAVGQANVRVNSAGTMVNVLSVLTDSVRFNGSLRGNAGGLRLGRFAFTFAADANETLSQAAYECPVLEIQTGVITATRNITVPGTTEAGWWVINKNTQAVVLKTAGGTGITVAAGRSRFVYFPTGVNAFGLTADQDYTT